MSIFNAVEDSTIYLPFETTDADGVLLAPSAVITDSHLEIVCEQTGTVRATMDGITVTSPFRSVAGSHRLTVNLGNDTGDATFWQAGRTYYPQFKTGAPTVDGKSIVGRILKECRFGIDAEHTSDATGANQTTLLDRLTGFVQLLARKDAGIGTDLAALLALINNDEGSGPGGYLQTTDSQEAIRDNQSGGVGLTQDDIDNLTAAITAVADQIQKAQANVITIIEGDKLVQQFTGLGSLVGRDNLVWCLKASESDADDNSLIMVDTDTGLLRVNKAAASDAARATLSVTDPDAGDVTLTIFADITDVLQSGHRFDGLKVIQNEGEDRHVRRGRTTVQAGIVETTGTVS